MKQRHIAAAMLSALMLTACGSSYSRQTTDLTAALRGAQAEGNSNSEAFAEAQYQFTLAMMQTGVQIHPDENQSFVPYLAAQMLMLAASGAAGETRTELEALFGGMETGLLNEYLAGWRRSQSAEQLNTAHSAWFKAASEPAVQQSYLQTLHSYYDAEAFTAAFDDSTVADLALWVSNRTDGQITEPAVQFDPADVFDLFSTAVFDAQWDEPYADNETFSGLFYAADGTQQTVRFLRKTDEETAYLSDENAVGLMRNYSGRRYAFAALMPQEMSVQEYLAQLTPAQLRTVLSNQKLGTVDSAIPEFAVSGASDLRPLLAEMGVQALFQAGTADLSGISEQPLHLGCAVQQTVFQVDRHGTEALYALDITAGESTGGRTYTVRLTKPFVWFVYDKQYGLPVMAGTVMTLQ